MSILTGQPGADGGQGAAAPASGAPAGNQDWRQSLPEDLRAEKVFESIKGKDWGEAGPILAKNYVHAQRMIGSDKLVLPNERSTPEEIAAFRSKLGVPAKPEEYTFKLPEGLTEDKLDKARVDLWRKELHEAGIPKQAAERLLTKYLSEEHGATQAAQAARVKEMEQYELAIKQEFGVKFDEKVNFARLALREFGNDNIVQLLETTGLGSHPEVVKLFASIGEKLGDDRARGTSGTGGGNPFASPDLAQAELQSFQRNPENMRAIMDRSHPNHDNVVEQRRKLFEAAFPKEAS